MDDVLKQLRYIAKKLEAICCKLNSGGGGTSDGCCAEELNKLDIIISRFTTLFEYIDTLEESNNTIADNTTPKSNINMEGTTEEVPVGGSLYGFITTTFSSVDVSKIKSLSIRALVGDMELGMPNGKTLKLVTNDSMSWNQGTHNYLSVSNLQNITFASGSEMQLIFEWEN